MKKKNLLWLALLLMLAGCSSDENEITINDNNILGYWESTATIDGQGGFLFLPDGEIKYWDYSLLNGNGTRQYSEGHWGLWWIEDVVGYEKSSAIHIKEGSKTPNPDELYYQVMSLTKDRLVIRIFGGFAGTPLEKGTDVVYNY